MPINTYSDVHIIFSKGGSVMPIIFVIKNVLILSKVGVEKALTITTNNNHGGDLTPTSPPLYTILNT